MMSLLINRALQPIQGNVEEVLPAFNLLTMANSSTVGGSVSLRAPATRTFHPISA
jgi:hypothetical protein